jgi:O-acetyl-ADP-ribose deacetylase (regulator of RNase III)
VEYDQAKLGSIEQAKVRIHQIIQNGLRRRVVDSPVHKVVDLNIEPEGKPIEVTERYEAGLKDAAGLVVGVITGDIQNVTNVDVWVNSENTNMQMARPFENSISGIIRYLGAAKDGDNGQIKTDTIVDELKAKMNDRTNVDPAAVLVTTSGEMWKTHKVKLIFHAAANYGQVGQGYVPIDAVARCVTNALKIVPPKSEHGKVESILFPLMATRSRRGAVLEERIRPLLNAAIDYLDKHPRGTFQKVYFLTYTDKELEVCLDILRADSRLQPVKFTEAGGEEPVADAQVSQKPGVQPGVASPGGSSAADGKKPAPASKGQADTSPVEVSP